MKHVHANDYVMEEVTYSLQRVLEEIARDAKLGRSMDADRLTNIEDRVRGSADRLAAIRDGLA